MSEFREISCPLCGQAATERVRPVEFDRRGIPLEGSVEEGFGVPVIAPLIGYRFLVDGREVDEVIAFSVPRGWIWRFQTNLHGNPIVQRMGRDRGLAREKLTGAIEVLPPAEKAA